MKSSGEKYLDYIDDLCGGNGEYYKIANETEPPPLTLIVYHNVPENGHITAFSYGLSSVNHPEWKYSKPELIISVNSSDNSWGLAMGDVIKNKRFTIPFSYGSIIDFGEKISKESDMSAFFIFANSFLDEKESTIRLADRKIFLSQLYPIYKEEIETIKRIGLEKFFFKREINFFDIKRPLEL